MNPSHYNEYAHFMNKPWQYNDSSFNAIQLRHHWNCAGKYCGHISYKYRPFDAVHCLQKTWTQDLQDCMCISHTCSFCLLFVFFLLPRLPSHVRGRAAQGKLNSSCISSSPDPPASQDAPQRHSAHHHPDDIIGVGQCAGDRCLWYCVQGNMWHVWVEYDHAHDHSHPGLLDPWGRSKSLRSRHQSSQRWYCHSRCTDRTVAGLFNAHLSMCVPYMWCSVC